MKQFYSKWVNDSFKDKIYKISKNGFGKPYVEEIRSDGYYTKLDMSMDQLFDFEGMLLKNGWRKV